MRLKDLRQREPDDFLSRVTRGACIGNTMLSYRDLVLYLYSSGRGSDDYQTSYSRGERGFRPVLRRKGTRCG